jgi:3-dehydroquinate synthase
MTRVTIRVQPRPYDAVIESGILSKAGELLHKILTASPDSSPTSRQIFVVTVPPVRRRWGRKVTQSLTGAGFKLDIIEMPDGERHKRLSTVDKLAEKLAQFGADRNAVVLAFGGGVVGDVAGLLASVYMRGVDVIQIPTTVLAQVDASIGGKTGVNLRTGKNLLGTFHQPRAVLIDPEVLVTLPDREFRAGLYESIKCGVIGTPALFEALAHTDLEGLRRDPAKLEWVITESVKLKADIVSRDEREGDLRRVLNFGHTIGHALEAETGYRQFLHGEAVAWGMIAATNISGATGRIDKDSANRVREAVLRLGPLPRVDVRSRRILDLLRTDKKTRNGKIHFVLPRKIGKVDIVSDVPERTVLRAVDDLTRFSKA